MVTLLCVSSIVFNNLFKLDVIECPTHYYYSRNNNISDIQRTVINTATAITV